MDENGHFNCKRCGQCCCNFGIPLSIEDIERENQLALYAVPYWMVRNRKLRAYMLEKGLPWAINKSGKGKPCVFLDAGNLCRIYETRPQICRDYPQKDMKCIREMQIVNINTGS